MAKKTKSYSLSNASIERVQKVQQEHNFDSESEALEYILRYQLNESKVKDMIYETLIKILSENSISFNSKVVEKEVSIKVNDEVEKAILDSTDDIYENMPD